MARQPRVLIISHGHPEQSPGGGEIAARALHRTLQQSGEFDSVFLARHEDPFPAHQGCAFSGTNDTSEILFHTGMDDRFLFKAANRERIWRHFRDMLETVRPDIVHFHHYLHLGLEMIGEVRRFNPNIPIAMTLHEYHAICHNDGLMVTTQNNMLCHRASAQACNGCFPERSVQDFSLRERYLKTWFNRIDKFIAPSEFLANRYADWGIERSRISVIENMLDPYAAIGAADPSRDNTTADSLIRLAFFGRISEMKGIDLLFGAFNLLDSDTRARIQIDIHGTGIDRMGLLNRANFKYQAWKQTRSIRYHGRYESADLPALIQHTDWMIVPSRWWENSPVVIQEAKRHGVPVICTGIGGMAEKIEHGVTGLHFQHNSVHALADQLRYIVTHPEQQRQFSERIRAASQTQSITEQHLALHRSLTGGGDVIAFPKSAIKSN